jgi:hypothetical protein
LTLKYGLGRESLAFIPDEMRIPIRDPEKQSTSAETDALRANQSLYDHLEQVQKAREQAYSDDPAEFTDIPIDPAILEHERQFRVQQQGVLNLDADEQEGSSGNERDDIMSSPPRSVISIDSIAENADFISLE